MLSTGGCSTQASEARTTLRRVIWRAARHPITLSESKFKYLAKVSQIGLKNNPKTQLPSSRNHCHSWRQISPLIENANNLKGWFCWLLPGEEIVATSSLCSQRICVNCSMMSSWNNYETVMSVRISRDTVAWCDRRLCKHPVVLRRVHVCWAPVDIQRWRRVFSVCLCAGVPRRWVTQKWLTPRVV